MCVAKTTYETVRDKPGLLAVGLEVRPFLHIIKVRVELFCPSPDPVTNWTERCVLKPAA